MATAKLYDLNAYIKVNEAGVVSCVKSEKPGYEGLYEVISDSTIFAPEGGGQKADRGTFGDADVMDVVKKGNEIVHFTSKELKVGETYTQQIDFDLRFRRMQNHNAEHLLCGIIHKNHGYNNVGFHISEREDRNGRIILETTMDVDGPLTSEDIAAAELEANKAVAENVAVYARIMEPSEAEGIPFRCKTEIEDDIRLVYIEGYDICACCAPCLKSSGEIQVVKVLDYMPHRGGTRITLTAGLDAISDYVMLHDSNREIMRILSSKREECSSAVFSLNDKMTEDKEEINSLKKRIVSLLKKDLERKIYGNNSAFTVFDAGEVDEIQARTLINDTVNIKEGVVLILYAESDKGYRFAAGKNDPSGKYSLVKLASKMRENLNARGGGNEQMIQGNISSDAETLEKWFEMGEIQ